MAFAVTMIRPRYRPDSIIAQKVSASAFLRSLDYKRKSGMGFGMSAYMSRLMSRRFNSLWHSVFEEPLMSESG